MIQRKRSSSAWSVLPVAGLVMAVTCITSITILNGQCKRDIVTRLTTSSYSTSLSSSSQRKQQCDAIFDSMRNKQNRSTSPKRPPWFDLMKQVERSNTLKYRKIFYLTSYSHGRFGNQMFGYAALFGIAWRNSRIPLWTFDKVGLRGIFNLRIGADHMNASERVYFTSIDEGYFNTYINETEALQPDDFRLVGYLQVRHYFAHVEDQLRHDFTFQPHVIAEAQRALDTMNSSIPTSWRIQGYVRVVIHVRRTDHVGVLYWHDPYPDYFVKSMAYFTDCLPRVQFIVISDDMTWCRRNVAGKYVDYMDGVRRPEVDLAIASLCDHAIITIGTFGWWSAWLANGVTIMQNDTRRP